MVLTVRFQTAPTLKSQKCVLYASRTFSLSDVGTEEQNFDIDPLRENGLGFQTLSHFQAAVDCDSPGLSHQPEKKLLTVREAANLRYEIQQKEKAKMRLKMKQDAERYGRRNPVLIATQGKEMLAESSRCLKSVSAGDSSPCDTVGGMKCQLHRQREKAAQKRALGLLEQASQLSRLVC